MGVFEELSWAAWHRCSFAPPKKMVSEPRRDKVARYLVE